MNLGIHRCTRADHEKLPEGYPVQLINGGLLKEPSPTYGHQDVVGHVLSEALTRGGSRTDGDVPHRRLHRRVQRPPEPDVLVVEKPLGPHALRAPLPILVLEVLSPSTAFRDRQVMRRIYLDAGVAEVWIVDPEARTNEVHTVGGPRTAAFGETARSEAVPGFFLATDQVFRG